MSMDSTGCSHLVYTVSVLHSHLNIVLLEYLKTPLLQDEDFEEEEDEDYEDDDEDDDLDPSCNNVSSWLFLAVFFFKLIGIFAIFLNYSFMESYANTCNVFESRKVYILTSN